VYLNLSDIGGGDLSEAVYQLCTNCDTIADLLSRASAAVDVVTLLSVKLLNTLS